ncbi:MAG: hypothetical protein H5T47_05185 [Archaeoglobi archaeon]|nr:hypothetical protein [Candidatus Mnemosynella bozhongmuii]
MIILERDDELENLDDEELMSDLHYWKLELEKMRLLVEREINDYRVELAKKEIEFIERQIERISNELERRRREREAEESEGE